MSFLNYVLIGPICTVCIGIGEERVRDVPSCFASSCGASCASRVHFSAQVDAVLHKIWQLGRSDESLAAMQANPTAAVAGAARS